ncbi:MAG: PAS domain S-box protein [Dehalogenimonas sp.]
MSSGLDLLKLFDIAPGGFLVLAADPPKFTILAVTDKYLSATQTKRDDIVGKGFLEVFPGNIADPASKAGDKVRSSFERVIGLRAPDSIGITEHEIPDAQGQFETRWWDTTNSPIFGAEGEVTAIMHRIEDVTRWEIQRRKLAEQDSAVVALRDARRAAINLMEDAIDARRQADEINDKLKKEIQEHREAESEILALSRFPMENPNPVLRVTAEGMLEYANSASSYVLSYWGVSRGDPLSGEIRAIIAETLEAGKNKQIELEFGGHFYDFVLAPVLEEGYVNLYAREITERKRVEARIRRLTEIHSILSKVDETIVRTSDKQVLFDEVCRIITEDGHYPLAWIGEVADEKVVPKSSSGSATDYLHDIRIEVHGALGKGPTGTAIRDNQSVVNVNFESNPAMSLWRSKAQEFGLGSSAAFPLRVNSNAIAVLTVYGSEPDAFDPEATALFESLSADVSYALETMIAKESKGRAEAALRESEDRYRSVVENTTSIILRLDLTGNITFANTRALEFFGYSKEELLGKPAVGTIVPNLETSGRDLAQMVNQIATDPDAFHSNANENVRKDGRRVWLEWTNSGIYGLDGKLTGFLSVGIDATERKKAEEDIRRLLDAVQNEKDRLLAFINNIPDEVWYFDADGNIELVNPPVIRNFGTSLVELRQAIKLNDASEVYQTDGEHRNAVDSPPVRALKGETVIGQEEVVRLPSSGELRTRQVNASPIKDAEGRINGVVAIVRDITERKKTEESLKKNQDTFVNLVERAPFGIYIVDSQFNIAQMNQSAQNRAFRNVRPIIGHDFNDAMRTLWPEQVASEIISHFRHTLETGETFFSPRFTNKRNDVETVESYEWELHRIILPDGQFGVISYYFDSTELREVQDKLELSEEKYRNLFRSMSEGFALHEIILDPTGKPFDYRFLEVNEAFAHLTGLTPSEIMGRTVREVMPDIENFWIDTYGKVALTGQPTRFENFQVHWENGTRSIPILLNQTILP